MASNPVGKDDPAYAGNELFVQMKYDEALEAYSKSIEKFPGIAKLYSNRALTYLKLNRPYEALKDIDIGLKIAPIDEKLIYRKCTALLAMRRYHEAADFLDDDGLKCLGRIPDKFKNDFKKLIDDMDRLKLEFVNGRYDLSTMVNESKTSPILSHHADYFAWNKFEIREIDGKGRGLVAKRKIEAGELLIACKAFVYFKGRTLQATVADVHKIVLDRPNLAEQFFRLYAGPRLGYLENGMEGESGSSIDDRIKSIINYNAFQCGSIFDQASTYRLAPGTIDAAGLWLVPSYINHSCVDRNCNRYFVGDFMFVRATKLIEKNEEILFSYVRPANSFEERQRRLRDLFGFECQCRLCVLECQESIEIKQEIEKQREFWTNVSIIHQLIVNSPNDIPKLKGDLQKLLQIRPQRDLNYLADKAEEVLSLVTYYVDKKESLRLLKANIETLKSNGDFIGALSTLKNMRRTSWFKGVNEQEKWKMEAREIAKLIYGDERMADLD